MTIFDALGWVIVASAIAATIFSAIRWNREYRAFRRQLEAQGIVFPEAPASLYLAASLVPLALILQALIFVASRGGHDWPALLLLSPLILWLGWILWMARRAHRKKLGRSS